MAEKIRHSARVELVGQMNDAAELRHVGGEGIPLATARVGVKSSKKDKSGEWKSTWLNFKIDAWREMAEELMSVPARSLVKITGPMKADEWVDKNTGAIRTSFTVEPETIEVLGETGGTRVLGSGPVTDSGLDAESTPF